VYDRCLAQVKHNRSTASRSLVKDFYKPFTSQQISDKVFEM
jgi:hypothetical protein